MNIDILKPFAAARASLEAERSVLRQRLQSIEAVLGSVVSAPTAAQITTKPTRKLSAAGRRAIAEAAKARWAKVRAKQDIETAKEETPTVLRRPLSGGVIDPTEVINRCKGCGRPAIPGDDYCYSCR
jgi:hypothetical protein